MSSTLNVVSDAAFRRERGIHAFAPYSRSSRSCFSASPSPMLSTIPQLPSLSAPSMLRLWLPLLKLFSQCEEPLARIASSRKMRMSVHRLGFLCGPRHVARVPMRGSFKALPWRIYQSLRYRLGACHLMAISSYLDQSDAFCRATLEGGSSALHLLPQFWR